MINTMITVQKTFCRSGLPAAIRAGDGAPTGNRGVPSGP